jgi:membrane protein YqaA with SNARE-associated domain
VNQEASPLGEDKPPLREDKPPLRQDKPLPRDDSRRYPVGVTALRILALVGVIAITVYVYSIRDQAEELARFGLPGIFLLSVLANATIIFPAPGLLFIFAAGGIFNPIWVAIAAGAGAILGELTGYLAGFSGRGLLENSAVYKRLEDLTRRFGGWTILVLAALPNPFFDIAGAAAGALRMPVATFLIYGLVGKVIKMFAFAYAGALSIDWILQFLE